MSGIIYVLAHLNVGSSLFPLFFLFIKRTKKINLFIKILAIEFVVINLLNLFLFYYTNLDQTNLFSTHIFTENCLILLIFRETKKSNYLASKLFFLLVLLNVVFFLSLFMYNSIERLVIFSLFSTLLMLLISITLLIQTYIKSQYENLLDDFLFNFSIAIIIYNGLQLYTSFFKSVILLKADELFLYSSFIVQVSSITCYLLITRAIWKLKN